MDLVDPNRHEYTYPEERGTTGHHPIVVVFDVNADTKEEAAEHVANAIGLNSPNTPIGFIIESWWFPEGDIKHVDGNDNDDMTLVARGRLLNMIQAWDEGDTEYLDIVMEALREQISNASE